MCYICSITSKDGPKMELLAELLYISYFSS